MDEEAEVPDWIPKVAGGLLAIFVTLSAAFWLLAAGPTEPEIAAPTSDRPSLIVYERHSCGWCHRFRKIVAPAYERSRLDSLAPMRYVDLDATPRPGYRLKGSIYGTPTSVLVDRRGREVGRIRGYPANTESFLASVERMLERIPDEPAGG